MLTLLICAAAELMQCSHAHQIQQLPEQQMLQATKWLSERSIESGATCFLFTTAGVLVVSFGDKINDSSEPVWAVHLTNSALGNPIVSTLMGAPTIGTRERWHYATDRLVALFMVAPVSQYLEIGLEPLPNGEAYCAVRLLRQSEHPRQPLPFMAHYRFLQDTKGNIFPRRTCSMAQPLSPAYRVCKELAMKMGFLIRKDE